MEPCDKDKREGSDYSALAPSLTTVSKPAQRALLNNNIRTAKDLAKWTREDLAALHGIGPSAFPKLEAALKAEGLSFKTPR